MNYSHGYLPLLKADRGGGYFKIKRSHKCYFTSVLHSILFAIFVGRRLVRLGAPVVDKGLVHKSVIVFFSCY